MDALDPPDEVDHVGTSGLLTARPLLQVQVDAVDAVVISPPGDLLSHGLRLLPGGQPLPGVGLQAVGVSSDGEDDPSIARDCPLRVFTPGRG